MPARAPKIEFATEAEAVAEVAAFDIIIEADNENTAARKKLREAFDRYFKGRLADEPTWDGVLYDAERGVKLSRNEQSWGHYYAVRDMPNEMILWLAEHGCLEAKNDAVAVFMEGDAPPRELIDIGKFKHEGARVTYTTERTARAS